jgi:hypothetical protein
MKIAILDCHDNKYEQIFKICNKSKIKYCHLNSYDFLEFKFSNIKEYGPTWGRLFGIEKNLKMYDWIFYLDTDTIITNKNIKIESLIDANYEIILGRMPDFHSGVLNHLSTSAMLIKNSKWNHDFIKLWLEQKQFIKNPYYASNQNKNLSTLGVGGLFYEQSALHYLYDTREDLRRHIKVIEGINDRESTHKNTSFLIHFARSPKKERIKKFLKKRIKI